ncbi:MAG: esterase-like activity of phytase family protein [Pseudomonadota bacterium]
MYRRLALVALLAALCAGPVGAQTLEQTGRVTWAAVGAYFGGFSGLSLSADGTRFITVSDRGGFATGRLIRDGARLVAIERTAEGPLRDPTGQPVGGFNIDAEGTTRGPDGTFYISFEANHRVWAYTDLGKPARALPVPPVFDRLQNNSALEALFTGPDGAIYAIPERSGRLSRPFPVYRFGGGGWTQAFTVPRRPPHLVTGADIGPDGRLYLLERHFRGLFGFSTRIRSFAVSPTGLSDERTLLESRSGTYDNLEGIAAWTDAAGALRLTLISDDNRNLLQRTEFVEFRLIPRPALRPRIRPRDRSPV